MVAVTHPTLGSFILKKTKTRGIKLAFASNGWLEVRMSRPSANKAIWFIGKNVDWIKKHYHAPTIIKSGNMIGKYELEFAEGNLDKVSFKKKEALKIVQVIIPANRSELDPVTQLSIYKYCCRLLTKQVEKDLHARCLSVIDGAGLHAKPLRIKPMNSRWGSCNLKGQIAISTFAIYLDEELLNYLVLHETAHLKHLNHSKEFWAYLSELCPTYLSDKKKLSKVKPRLRLVYTQNS